MNSFLDFYILNEGGAAGHMAHPFDLLTVKTGRDLINFFEKAAKSLSKKPAAVKIDGVNASVKLITNEDGSKEFALDRGSNKKDDIQGITIERLSERFPEGHGMIEIGKTVLTIFNKALPVLVDDLKKLGLYENSNLFLNIEYVQGSTNVVGYSNNFLAIHGVNKFYNVKSPTRGSISRSSKEVAYNKNALLSLVAKLQKVAKAFNFNVLHTVTTEASGKVNFADILNTNLTFNYSAEHSETKTMRAWLERCGNPRNKKIRLVDGKMVDALNKQIYLKILGGDILSDFIDPKSIDFAVCGTIIMHATRLLGSRLLGTLKSELGNVTDQEGIVLRDRSISSIPVKITGEFIVKGMESKFRK
jgi:hypothetical protein